MLEAQGRREFVGQADQVAAARRFVVSAIHAPGPARDITRLLVSEAATNATPPPGTAAPSRSST